MLIGEVLLAHGLVTVDQLEQALNRQKEQGGRLGDNLRALGFISAVTLDQIMNDVPPAPRSIEETGLNPAELLRLMLKTIHARSLETPSSISRAIKIPYRVILDLIREATDRRLMETLGADGKSSLAENRYVLTESGKSFAAEALQQNQYSGPAPVSLNDYCERVARQRITNERIDSGAIEEAFHGLVITEDFVRRLGPGINSGRSILLYGPPGNGKTTIAERVASIFENVIYIPYAFEVDGQIIKVFDPSIHQAMVDLDGDGPRVRGLRREEFDGRWIPCRRPVIVTGGELTLEMLDLSFNSVARYYEAPLHVKALNGTFIIDDFGRQIVSPEELLNRWIVPLQSRVDYLKLHTGKSFQLPFDELVIFSTNLSPDDLMDPAFLRRIPYKLETVGPEPADFFKILRNVARENGLDVTEDIFALVLEELLVKNNYSLACYQPKFLVDQVVAACKYRGEPPTFSEELVLDAIENLYTTSAKGRGVTDDSVNVENVASNALETLGLPLNGVNAPTTG